MKFKEFLNEKKPTKFQAPKGFFDDESMADDFASEMSLHGLEWDESFEVSDDNKFVTFFQDYPKDVLKSWKFKKV